MSELLTIPNYSDINIVQVTELVEDAPEDQAYIDVVNTTGIAVNDFLVIGEDEEAERITVQSITDNRISFASGLKRHHGRGATVRKLRGNQAIIYYANHPSNNKPPAATDYTNLLATVDLAVDSEVTEYLDEDNNAGSGRWYKFVYFNSENLKMTSLEDVKGVRGGGIGYYCTVQDVLEEAGLSGNVRALQKAERKRKMAQGIVNGYLGRSYYLPLNSVPDIVAETTALLAAGYLLLTSFATGEDETEGDGKAKIKEAKAILEQIANGVIRLYGEDSVQLPTSQTDENDSLSGYPNALSDNDPMFTKDMEF